MNWCAHWRNTTLLHIVEMKENDILLSSQRNQKLKDIRQTQISTCVCVCVCFTLDLSRKAEKQCVCVLNEWQCISLWNSSIGHIKCVKGIWAQLIFLVVTSSLIPVHQGQEHWMGKWRARHGLCWPLRPLTHGVTLGTVLIQWLLTGGHSALPPKRQLMSWGIVLLSRLEREVAVDI